MTPGVTDAEIRALLLELGRITPETPKGFVRVPVAEVAQRADATAVAVWVANAGGLVEGTEPYESKAIGQGRWQRTVVPREESFLVPERALTR
jgi:hypothetical protein